MPFQLIIVSNRLPRFSNYIITNHSPTFRRLLFTFLLMRIGSRNTKGASNIQIMLDAPFVEAIYRFGLLLQINHREIRQNLFHPYSDCQRLGADRQTLDNPIARAGGICANRSSGADIGYRSG